MRDTIVALSSGRPPAAIAVIRVSGPQAQAAAKHIAGDLPIPRQAILRTLRHPATGIELDSALVLRFDAPHSATGEDLVEYQCHGGRAVVAAMLDALTSLPGIRLAEPGEFTRRALAAGRIDLTEAEGLADLLEAETEQQRRTALALAGGALSRQVDQWQSRILSLSARAEAAIDYIGDEEETATDTAALRAEASALATELRSWFARPRAERLKEGIRVVIAGPPNTGKSSLLNALTGFDRAIVTAVAGTTRDSIEVPLSVDGLPLVLIDTAGLRDTADPVEAIGIARALDEAARAEIVLWLGDPQDAPFHPNLVMLAPKCDLYGQTPSGVESRLDSPMMPLAVSSVTGENIPELLHLIAGMAGVLLPGDDVIALNDRQASAIAAAADQLSDMPDDLLLVAEHVRNARISCDHLTGRAGIEDVIDGIFARFCLGK